MNFAFREEQKELQKSIRHFFQTQSDATRLRQEMLTASGFNPSLWDRMCNELGLTSLPIPEAYGGAGFGYVELASIMEEIGYFLVCSPFLSSIVMGATAILTCGTEEQKEQLLPALATGEQTATIAWAEPGKDWDFSNIATTLVPQNGESYSLSGTKAYVVDGHQSDILMVVARSPNTSGSEGLSVVVLPSNRAGITRKLCPTMDATRKLAHIDFHNVAVSSSEIVGEVGKSASNLERCKYLILAALAAEQMGSAQRCLDMAVEYAKVRTQFGRAIGSFQAIKHKCADMMVLVESARSASYYACWVAQHDPENLQQAALMAKAYCSDALFQCASENIQIHGGIGFTWEHEAHLFFKRAQSSSHLFGSAQTHREHLAHQLDWLEKRIIV
jgi:alkylation response protein AidB-like acyl-CoA dehydrogenase